MRRALPFAYQGALLAALLVALPPLGATFEAQTILQIKPVSPSGEGPSPARLVEEFLLTQAVTIEHGSAAADGGSISVDALAEGKLAITCRAESSVAAQRACNLLVKQTLKQFKAQPIFAQAKAAIRTTSSRLIALGLGLFGGLAWIGIRLQLLAAKERKRRLYRSSGRPSVPGLGPRRDRSSAPAADGSSEPLASSWLDASKLLQETGDRHALVVEPAGAQPKLSLENTIMGIAPLTDVDAVLAANAPGTSASTSPAESHAAFANTLKAESFTSDQPPSGAPPAEVVAAPSHADVSAPSKEPTGRREPRTREGRGKGRRGRRTDPGSARPSARISGNPSATPSSTPGTNAHAANSGVASARPAATSGAAAAEGGGQRGTPSVRPPAPSGPTDAPHAHDAAAAAQTRARGGHGPASVPAPAGTLGSSSFAPIPGSPTSIGGSGLPGSVVLPAAYGAPSQAASFGAPSQPVQFGTISQNTPFGTASQRPPAANPSRPPPAGALSQPVPFGTPSQPVYLGAPLHPAASASRPPAAVGAQTQAGFGPLPPSAAPPPAAPSDSVGGVVGAQTLVSFGPPLSAAVSPEPNPARSVVRTEAVYVEDRTNVSTRSQPPRAFDARMQESHAQVLDRHGANDVLPNAVTSWSAPAAGGGAPRAGEHAEGWRSRSTRPFGSVIDTTGEHVPTAANGPATSANPPPAEERPSAAGARPSSAPGRSTSESLVVHYDISGRHDAERANAGMSARSELRALCDQLFLLAKRGAFVVRVASDAASATVKSEIAAQLAWSLAEFGQPRVLLMEADFDSPGVHRVMGVSPPAFKGFSQQVYARVHGAERAPWSVARYTPYLGVLAEGMIRTPGMLPTVQFSQGLAELRRVYDLIVVDGPVAGSTADTRALDGVADGVVFAVSAGEAAADGLSLASEQFGDKPLLWIIHTSASDRRSNLPARSRNG